MVAWSYKNLFSCAEKYFTHLLYSMSQVKYFSTLEEKFAYPCAAMLYMYPLCHVRSCSIRIMYCYCF